MDHEALLSPSHCPHSRHPPSRWVACEVPQLFGTKETCPLKEKVPYMIFCSARRKKIPVRFFSKLNTKLRSHCLLKSQRILKTPNTFPQGQWTPSLHTPPMTRLTGTASTLSSHALTNRLQALCREAEHFVFRGEITSMVVTVNSQSAESTLWLQ